MNPARQHSATILQSFVDSDALNTAAQDRPSGDHFIGARSRLRPGYRGFWIIPLSGDLPIPGAAQAVWHDTTPHSTTSGPSSVSPSAVIYWTDDRLRALWKVLSQLHTKGAIGSLRASACASAQERPIRDNRTKSTEGTWPDHIRIACDAHLALPLRSALSLISSGTRAEPGGETVSDASYKFLKNTPLLWTDEEGSPVLLA